MTNKELPAVEPSKAPPLTVREVSDEIARAAQRERNRKERSLASSFLGKFFSLFGDYAYHSGRNHKRKAAAVSTRSEQEIVAEVTDFYSRRPRPWRPASRRQKVSYAVRYHYRRSAD